MREGNEKRRGPRNTRNTRNKKKRKWTNERFFLNTDLTDQTDETDLRQAGFIHIRLIPFDPFDPCSKNVGKKGSTKIMQAEKRQARISDAILMEMDQEAETTKRLFDVIPDDKLSWRPHAKARSLGELAMHIATMPLIAEMADLDEKEAGTFPVDPEATSRAQLLAIFAESLEKGKAILAATDDTRAMGEWKLTKDGATLFALPRMGVWRMILLNHNYHHRGQLSAYLRELDVELPSIYGPSADTNPFA